MSKMIFPKRGEIWWAFLGTGTGSEQLGNRPVLIIQNDVGNECSPTVIVAALTDSHKRYLPTHVKIKKECGLPKDSMLMAEQIRTIDKKRMTSRIAILPDSEMKLVEEALKISIGLIPLQSKEGAMK